MDIAQTLADFEEQIASFYHRFPSRAEAQRQLAAHCEEMFGQLPQMLPILNDYPVYAGIAFHGRMQIVDRKLIASLTHTGATGPEAITALRAAKALRIAASARSGWELLLCENQEALWCAVQLNALATLPSSGKARDEDDDEDDEEEDDECGDDDCEETDED